MIDDFGLERRERSLVVNTCYEIGLLVDPLLFYRLFERNFNTFGIIGLSDEDYQEISFSVRDTLACCDDFYMKYIFVYDIFNEIASKVDIKTFLNLFKEEENALFFLDISDEKFKSLCLSVNEVRDIILYEDSLEKKLLFK